LLSNKGDHEINVNDTHFCTGDFALIHTGKIDGAGSLAILFPKTHTAYLLFGNASKHLNSLHLDFALCGHIKEKLRYAKMLQTLLRRAAFKPGDPDVPIRATGRSFLCRERPPEIT
jgi:hypothetical protein